MNAPPEITVLLPTRNPHQGRLTRTLDGLASQSLSSEKWELVLVDSGSTPALTTGVLARLPVSSRLEREERAGLTRARLAGFAAARGRILIFVDDDNVLAADYLFNALDFMTRHSEVGAIGGRIRPEFSTPPPAWVLNHAAHLALRDFGPTPLVSPTGPEAARVYPWFSPIGAGLVVRRECVARYAEWCARNVQVLDDRNGERLGACGDTELVIRGCLQAGKASAYSPTLELTHLIPEQRLGFRYLARLISTCSHDWAQLCVRLGYEKPIPAWTLAPRIIRAFFLRRGWTRSGWLSTCQAAGHFRGRIRAASESTP